MTHAWHLSTPFLHTGYLIAVDNDPLPLHKVAGTDCARMSYHIGNPLVGRQTEETNSMTIVWGVGWSGVGGLYTHVCLHLPMLSIATYPILKPSPV